MPANVGAFGVTTEIFPSYKEMPYLCVLLSHHPWLLSQECQCMAAMVKQTGRQNGMNEFSTQWPESVSQTRIPKLQGDCP